MLRVKGGKSRSKALDWISGGRDFLVKDGTAFVVDEDVSERPPNINANGRRHLCMEHARSVVPCDSAIRERAPWKSMSALVGKARHDLVGEQVKRTEHLFTLMNPLLDEEKTLFNGEFLARGFNTARNRIRVANQ